MKKTFNISTDVVIRHNAYLKRNRTYAVVVSDDEEARRILVTTKLLDEHGEVGENLSVVKNLVIQNPCCRRAFLRGAFLAAGSISDPERSYHFEIVCTAEAKAHQLQAIIKTFGMEAKIVMRKKYYVVYIKEGSQIADILKVMEAPISLMELENIRILKEMRGSVNRQVNCETANINKTVSAAVKQIEDIVYIRDTIGFEGLPENLEEIAKARLERPEATLKELGEGLDPPVGLEARPVAMLVQVASQYDSNIYVECGTKRVNAKSIMGMMTLGLVPGEQVTVTADGADEEKAIEGIEKYLTEG